MSTLSDSDDSDDAFLLQPRIFAKPKAKKKQQLIPIETLEKIVSGKPITTKKDGTQKSAGRKRMKPKQKLPSNKKRVNSNSDHKYKGKISRDERHNDPEWVEKQARKTVEEVLRLDIVDNLADLNDIGWYRCTAKKGHVDEYFPAIISQNKAEAKMLLGNKRNRNYKTKRIQYIGVRWRYALTHDEIALSKWIPYTKSSDSENEERLKKFVEKISKTSLFKRNPLDLKIEELAIRRMWEKVGTQEQNRKIAEKKDRTEALESACSIDQPAAVAPATFVTQDSSDNNSQNSNEGVMETDSDDGYDTSNVPSPGRKQTKQTPLHLHDEIEFYDSIGTFGNPSSLRRATIVGIRNDSSYPVFLSNTTTMIPGTHRIRRIGDNFWQPINDYDLHQGGIQSIAESGSGFHEVTQRMRKINDKIVQAKESFWKNEHHLGKNENEIKDQNDGSANEDKTNGKGINANDVGIEDDSTNKVSPFPIRQSRRSSARIRRKLN